jgi:hypothetical protein
MKQRIEVFIIIIIIIIIIIFVININKSYFQAKNNVYLYCTVIICRNIGEMYVKLFLVNVITNEPSDSLWMKIISGPVHISWVR